MGHCQQAQSKRLPTLLEQLAKTVAGGVNCRTQRQSMLVLDFLLQNISNLKDGNAMTTRKLRLEELQAVKRVAMVRDIQADHERGKSKRCRRWRN
jgi:hypothetical protein